MWKGGEALGSGSSMRNADETQGNSFPLGGQSIQQVSQAGYKNSSSCRYPELRQGSELINSH